MKTIISTSAQRPTTAQARSMAKVLLTDVMAALQEKAPKVWGNMPRNVMQNDDRTLKRAVAALLKVGDSANVKKARQAFGYMIVAGIYTPF